MQTMPLRTSPPLGLRALVTRPRAEAAALGEALAARGIEAIVEPLLDIHYRGEAMPVAGGGGGVGVRLLRVFLRAAPGGGVRPPRGARRHRRRNARGHGGVDQRRRR